MKTLRKPILKVLIAFFFLAGGLAIGGLHSNVSANEECSREACISGDCEFFGNMTECDDNSGECEDGVCHSPPDPPPSDPIHNSGP